MQAVDVPASNASVNYVLAHDVFAHDVTHVMVKVGAAAHAMPVVIRVIIIFISIIIFVATIIIMINLIH